MFVVCLVCAFVFRVANVLCFACVISCVSVLVCFVLFCGVRVSLCFLFVLLCVFSCVIRNLLLLLCL